MIPQDQSSGSYPSECTDFGKASHQDLFAMVESADPGSVVDIGARLQSAATKMHEISDELHAHMSGLEWEGQAADSFKSWGGQVSTATMQLGDYSNSAGTYMQRAGETLSDVRSAMPPVPTEDMNLVSRYQGQPNIEAKIAGGILGAFTMPVFGGIAGYAEADRAIHAVDSSWVTQDMAQAASKRVADAHAEAVQQMTKLGQSYDQSISQLNQAQPPTFPAPPGSGRGGETTVPVGGGGGTGTGGGSTGGGGGGFHQPRWSPPKETGPVAPPVHHPAPGPTPGPGPVSTLPPNPIPNPGTGLDSVPTLPTPTTPPVGTPSTGLPGGGGGGLGGPGGGGGLGPAGAGYIPGGFPGTGGLSSSGAGGGSGSRGGGTAGGSTGTGARTGTAGAGGAGQAGKSGASAMPHGGGMGGAGGAKGGGSRGSGLTSRAGGTVGGRRGPAAGGAFTEGGTGLRGRAERGKDGRAGQGGMAGGHGAGGKSNREKRNRADYLYEDEDTWTSGMGPVNPGVIE